MQILLHTDNHIDASAAMTDHLQTELRAALGRFGERVMRVEAHLSDVDSAAKSGADNIHCLLEARLVGEQAVVVKDHAGNAHQAIEGAVRKLKRAVGTVIAKHDPRGAAKPAAAPVVDEPA